VLYIPFHGIVRRNAWQARSGTPRDIPFETDAEYQRLAKSSTGNTKQELQKISKSALPEFGRPPGRNQMKKMKLHCKDEMERIAARIIRRAGQLQPITTLSQAILSASQSQ